MEELDAVYMKILGGGLTAIRDAAGAGDLPRCQAEAEHIHNIPSLIGEKNKLRHLDYLGVQRTLYLEWVLSTKRKDLKKFVSLVYIPCWDRMVSILGIDDISAEMGDN